MRGSLVVVKLNRLPGFQIHGSEFDMEVTEPRG